MCVCGERKKQTIEKESGKNKKTEEKSLKTRH